MREWLTIIIVLLILGILLDGVRRMRAYRKNALRMSRNVHGEGDSVEVPNSEFPSGGARIVAYRDSKDTVDVTRNARENYTASRKTKGSSTRTTEQEALNLDVPVPMLMDTFSNAAARKVSDRSAGYSSENEQELEEEMDLGYGDEEPGLGSLDNLDDNENLEVEHPNYTIPRPDSEMDESVSRYKSPMADHQREVSFSKVEDRHPEQRAPAKVEKLKAPDLVLVINVMAHRGEVFTGANLLNALVSNGLRFGEMDIFHRHESSDGKGKILFSLANIVMPGVFDLSGMDDFETPGFSMFLSLPIASDSLSAYNLMAQTAQALAQELDGELKDEHRSVMTRQTIDHDRQRVIEYERKKRLERA